MTDIVLTTLNARYIHSAFGLRYLYANLGELRQHAVIKEFTIHERPIDLIEKILAEQPKIVCFSLYIWNIEEATEAIALVKEIAPDVCVIIGGPEVSHPPDLPAVAQFADYIITGPGEISLKKLCDQLLNDNSPEEKIIIGEALALDQLELPYQYYTDEDIRNRIVYVEASRGCPFKCEFCLSSLDKTAKPFELGKFLEEMDKLYQRGARNFKFIDRTFNLKVSSSVAILEFFLERMTDDLYLHFEVIPDNLPDLLKETLVKFPENSLQFEIGVQSFDHEIQALISRRQNNEKTCENISWLRQNTGAHIHADLIFGLPQDTLDNFSKSFDKLYVLQPQEIQLGILKRLRGAPLNRHIDTYKMRFNPKAPYNILSTRDIDFNTMQRVNRFARLWDMVGNSGRFKHTLPIILRESPFDRFMQFSDSLYSITGSTWKIALKRLFDLIYTILTENMDEPEALVQEALFLDQQRTGQTGKLKLVSTQEKPQRAGKANKRQLKHL